jgi:hypothetical protein
VGGFRPEPKIGSFGPEGWLFIPGTPAFLFRNGGFFRPDYAIEVFPQFGVLLEVDEDIGFLAGLVDDESHAFHQSLLLFLAD